MAKIFAEADTKEIHDAFVRTQESPWLSEEVNGWNCPIPVLPPEAFTAPEGMLHCVG